jgi:hypothetical protein
MNNFTLLRPTVASVMIFGLAACGGGGGSTTEVEVTIDPTVQTPTQPTDTSTAGQRAAATALLTEWAPTNPPIYTNLSVIPTTGSAEYAGFVYGELSNDSDTITDSVIGSLNLEVGFNAGGASFGGSASGFVDEDDNDLTGNLTVSSGSLDRTGNPADDATIGISLAGTLTDDADQDLVFGFALEGDFLGSEYNAIGGAALGSVTVDGVDQNFDGGFIAEQ